MSFGHISSFCDYILGICVLVYDFCSSVALIIMIFKKCYVTNKCGHMLKIADDPFSDKYYTNMAISSTFQYIALCDLNLINISSIFIGTEQRQSLQGFDFRIRCCTVGEM